MESLPKTDQFLVGLDSDCRACEVPVTAAYTTGSFLMEETGMVGVLGREESSKV